MRPSDHPDLPILGELRELLGEHMRAADRPRRRGWARLPAPSATVRALPVALATVATLAMAVAALVVLRGGHGPRKAAAPSAPRHVVPQPLPPGANHDIDEAQRVTIRHDPACRQPVNRGQTFLQGVPPRSLLTELAVLRRPAAPPDASTRALYREGFNAGQGVYVRYVRRTRTAYGRTFYIIPVAHVTPFGRIPQRCFGEFRAALGRIVAPLPAAQRHQILERQAAGLSAERAQTERQGGLCFASVGEHAHPPLSGVSMGCTPDLSDLRDPIGGGLEEGDGAGGTIIAGPVSDGIASVTVHYSADGRFPARTVTARVLQNVYVLRVPRDTAHRSFPTSVVMRNRDGVVIPPPPGARLQFVGGSG